MSNERPQLSELIDRARAGDRAAREELAAALYTRTVRLTAAMLRDFPVVQQRRSADSVAQDLWVQLVRALDARVDTHTTAEFLRLAANRLWRLLVDEARKCRGRAAAIRDRHPHGDGRVVAISQIEADGDGAFEPADERHDDPHATEWEAFHARVAALPDDQREVVKMRFYAGASNKDIAGALGLTEKQASRLWLAAVESIRHALPALD